MKFLKINKLVILAFLALSACSVLGDVSVKVAPYKVISKDGVFEIRQYADLTLVSTAAPDGANKATVPFYKLFGYISGKNNKTQKIDMTAPVLMEQINRNTEYMSFVLPADITLAEAPIPNDPTVKLEHISNYNVAVISFSGPFTQDTISHNHNLLQKWIAENNLTIVGTVHAAGYNPPFTLPFLRRNEIIIAIEKT
ncbi:MAG: heme-binding protein [Magnetovibrio sp.]|nr:heme-binding protein [Magnetovibrio sp.]|tara:strand:+ start:683 stop:1273 length:591 start_codon:yes stop_codon:yes gene_type:complete